MAAYTFSEAFAPGPLESNGRIENPYGIDSILVDVAGFGFVIGAAAILAGVVSLVVRFRRAEGVERQQIKWLALAGCFAVATFAAAPPVSMWSEPTANALIVLGVLALPIAVGVAVLRYRLEAMTNAARHAQAQSCRVRVFVDGALDLEISDDGNGVPSGHRAGVGLASMHERADELGGTCQVEWNDGSGTRVRARLPLVGT